MKYFSIASGSCGNAHYFESMGGGILIDAGITGKALEEGLRTHGVSTDNLRAILITHEHVDHIKGAGILSRRFNLPIYATAKTWEAMEKPLGKIQESNRRVFDNYESFALDFLEIQPFPTSHDAADSVGYTVSDGVTTMALATDLGYISQEVRSALLGADGVILEANHDVHMLQMGGYPYVLKRRILSDRGHLSNDSSAEMVVQLIERGTRQIFLAHLSHENNMPLIAYQTVIAEMKKHNMSPELDAQLLVLERGRPSNVFNF